MENNIVLKINEYKISSTDCFFLDNNVWMFLFCPLGNYQKKKQKAYSQFFSDILTHRASICINSLVLSEFANTYLRLDYQLWKKAPEYCSADYKRDYLHSKQYSMTTLSVQAAMRSILKISERMPDNFNSVDMDLIFDHFKTIDFNDSYFIEYCRSCGKNMLFVSDDKDFSKIDCCKVKVLTI